LRTLVVSDLHIGAAHGRARLDDDAAVESLAAAVAQADRLVLLGDVLELRQRPMRDALAAASRVLPRLVAGLGGGREVVLVAGNHDHELFAAWASRRAQRAVHR
jgi:UDP-2,3-diacylglucosamine pyrophosphatase LpxH